MLCLILGLNGNSKRRNSYLWYNLLWLYTFCNWVDLVFISWNMHSKCCSTRRIKVVWPWSIPFNSFLCAACNTRSSRNCKPCWVLQRRTTKIWLETMLGSLYHWDLWKEKCPCLWLTLTRHQDVNECYVSVSMSYLCQCFTG